MQATSLQWQHARACVEAAIESHPGCVVPVQKIINNFLKHKCTQSGELTSADIASIVKVTQWCAKNGAGEAISHVLAVNHSATDACSVRMVAVNDAYLGGKFYSNSSNAAAGVHLESIAKFLSATNSRNKVDTLQFVSDAYLTAELTRSLSTSEWFNFFKSCGVKTGVGFQAVRTQISSADKLAVPEKLTLRNSRKCVDLPYGLGTLSHKRAVAVDVDFDPDWIKIVEAIGATER